MSENRQSVPMVHIELASTVLGLAEEHEPGFFIIPHMHDSPQLIYATEGVMTVETDDGRVGRAPGTSRLGTGPGDP